ncbi:MAG: hypothetical protein M0R03_20570 [Novosphingobium sp.]|nr:hypothetical protein [Novosphingobium sp.]
MSTVNLGLIAAIYVGTTAPTNKKLIWIDTGETPNVHKWYNTTSGSWESFLYSTLIDNITIKKDVDGKLYVDVSTIPELQVSDGSVTLAKLADVASGTVFYRRSSGTGSPEVQTLAQLKSDLGLMGNNTGDQDLSGLALKATTINGKPLNANITLTPEDIGSPEGSGSSTGTNTGDETKSGILSKLEISILSGDNTGDETKGRILNLFSLIEEDESDPYTLILESDLEKLQDLEKIPEITLPSDTTVAGRISSLTEGTDYPTGWSLSVGESEFDLLITHNKGKKVFDIKVYSVDSLGKERMLIPFDNAYSGILTIDSNSVQIEALSEVQRQLKIYIEFV